MKTKVVCLVKANSDGSLDTGMAHGPVEMQEIIAASVLTFVLANGGSLDRILKEAKGNTVTELGLSLPPVVVCSEAGGDG